MDLSVENKHSSPVLPSYQHSLEIKQEVIWRSLAHIELRTASDQWLNTIRNPCTRKSYDVSMEELYSRRFLDPQCTLQLFSLISPESVIDRIKTAAIYIRNKNGIYTEAQWSQRTRESRIACFLAFTRYLSRKTEGIIRRGVPSKDGVERTFSPQPRRVRTEAMTRSQLVRFFGQLDKINARDALIARICLHGGKRINEVLCLRTEQIDYEKKQITFKQSKSHLTDDITIINFERQAARALLSNRAVEAITVEDVTKHADVAKGTF